MKYGSVQFMMANAMPINFVINITVEPGILPNVKPNDSYYSYS